VNSGGPAIPGLKSARAALKTGEVYLRVRLTYFRRRMRARRVACDTSVKHPHGAFATLLMCSGDPPRPIFAC
jgi:hypothetical protein